MFNRLLVLALFVGFAVFVLGCRKPHTNLSTTNQIYFTKGLNAGLNTIPFDGKLPTGWPSELLPPADSLIAPIGSRKQKEVNLIVRMDPESLCSYFIGKCNDLSLRVERQDIPIKDGRVNRVLQIHANSALLYITVFSSGYGVRTIPDSDAKYYVYFRFDSRPAFDESG